MSETTSRDSYAELAELTGGFIHEIKNHLSTLGLNLQLLAEDFHDPQSQRERRALDRALRLQHECQRLVDVSNDFLRFARVKDLEASPADLAEVVDEVVDFFLPTARQAGCDVKTYLSADLPPVRLDKEMFKQAVLNLLLNAVQAMPNGGDITAQTSPARLADGRDGVCFEVIDAGVGMTPEVLAQIFRPFFSTKPGGNGLGLATTRKIVEGHGGTLHGQSAVGCGTKFTVLLPAEPPTGTPGRAPAPPPRTPQ